eukprot:XP_015572324.1 pectinesterase inhibitor 5 [Ricinus communis]
MASLLLRPFSLIIILLMIIFLIETKGDQALIEDICRQTQDYSFCMSSFNGDLRSGTADIYGLATLSTIFSLEKARDTLERINGMVNGTSDPVGKNRIVLCQSDYRQASEMFQQAFSSSSVRSYWDVINYTREGFNRVVDCENVYRRDDPIAVCPVSKDNHEIFKLTEITLLIISRLLS